MRVLMDAASLAFLPSPVGAAAVPADAHRPRAGRSRLRCGGQLRWLRAASGRRRLALARAGARRRLPLVAPTQGTEVLDDIYFPLNRKPPV